MPGYNVGQAYIQISPSFDGFANELTSRMRVAGDQGARDFARAFVEQLRRSTRDANIGPGTAALAQQGAAGGAKFAESFKATIEAALRTLPDITIDANTTPAQRELAALKARLKTLGDQEIGVDIDSADAVKEMERIRAGLLKLQRESADIDVKVDTNRAIRNLDELRAEIARVDRDHADVGVSTSNARQEVRLLTVAIASLVPAALVAGAAVGGALIGVAPAAGTAALAVLGIRDAWKSGALDGTSFAKSVIEGNDALTELKSTATAGILPGLDAGLQGLLGQLSPVNDLVSQFSTQMGGIAGTTGPALASVLTQLTPLFTAVGNLLQIGANKLALFAESGDGVKQFSDFVLGNLPNVLDTLGEVAGALVHIVQAAAPIGQVVLTVFGAVSDVVSALPVSVLTGFTAAILATVVAMKIFGTVAAIQTGITEGTSAIVGFQRVLQGLGRTFNIVALQSISLRATMLVSLGVFGLIAGAIAAVAASTGDSADNSQAAKAAYDAYAESVKKSTDALNEVNVASTKKQLADQGALALLDDLQKKNLATGLTYDSLAKAANGSQAEFNAVANALRKASESTDSRVAQGNIALLLGSITNLRNGLKGQIEAQERYNDSIQGQLTDLDSVSRLTGIASDVTKKYAETLGYVVTESGAVAGAQANVAGDILALSNAFTTATQTSAGFLDAMTSFSSSAGTAADRANLIGATLKASNGDALNYASQINAAAVAQDQFAQSIKQAADSVGKNGISTKAYLRSIIDLKTGTIDYKNAAAAPLISSLTGIQTAAVNAAKASYQHTVATKGGKAAADEAYRVYVSQTKGQLIDQAKKLGLTGKQAERLAKAYLDTPDHVKTLVEQEGANPVVEVLKQIRNILGELTGHPFRTRIDTYGNAIANVQQLREQLASLPRSVGVSVNAQGQIAVKGGGRYAKGGTIPPNTRFTVGEEGWEGGVSDAQGRVTIFSHAQSQAMGYSAPVGYAKGTGGAADVPSLAKFFRSAVNAVIAQIRAAIATPDVSPKRLARTFGARQSTAVRAEQRSERAEAIYNRADRDADKLEARTRRIKRELAAERREGKKASKERIKQLADEAAKAQENARKARAHANKLKQNYSELRTAARDAASDAKNAAKDLLDALTEQADTFLKSVADFRDGIVNSLTSGSSLADVLGKAAAAVTPGPSVDDAAARVTAATAALDQAQANLAAAQQKVATTGGTPADYAALTAAQRAQSEAVAQLAAANTNLADARTQADQASQSNQNPVVSAAALQAQFTAQLKSVQDFAADLKALAKAGAGQDLIEQVAALGPETGDQLAKSLLAAGPAGITALQKTMSDIATVAGGTGDALGSVFYAKGQQSILQLVNGLSASYPALRGELNKIAAEVAAAFGVKPAAKPAAKAAPKATPKAAPKKPVAKKPTTKKSKKKSKKKAKKAPRFATGAVDFTGPAAYVHEGELLINNRTPGMDVLTSRQVDSLLNIVHSVRAPRFPGAVFLDSAQRTPDVQVFIGDEAIDPRFVRIGNAVVDARVRSAQSRRAAGVRGGALDHLARG